MNLFIYIIYIMSFLLTVNLIPTYTNQNEEVRDSIKKFDELNQFIDLGYGFQENIMQWVGKTPFTVLKQDNGNNESNYLPFYASNDFIASDYSATYLDAPYRFNKNGWTVSDIPINNLLVQGVLLDMRNKTINNTEFLVTPYHLMEWEHMYGLIPNNSVLLINFGWSSRWNDKTSYLGLKNNSDNKCHFPGLSEDAAHWIVNTQKIVGVGVDTASVDLGVTTDFKVHKILSFGNIYNIENINFNSDTELPVRGFDLIIMPIKTTEGSGAPCRLIAIPPNTAHKNSQMKTNFKCILNGASNYNLIPFLLLFKSLTLICII